GEAEAEPGAGQATAPLTDRSDPDKTDAPLEGEPAPLAVSGPASAVVLPGGPQLSAVESGRRPFFRSAAHIGRQVAAGLSYAHARGNGHRGIQTSELFLGTRRAGMVNRCARGKGGAHG